MSYKVVNENMTFQFKVNFKPASPSLYQCVGGRRILDAGAEILQDKLVHDPRIRK